MNYANLSRSELVSLCLTDDGARKYVAEHAEELLEGREEELEEQRQEAFEAGKEEGEQATRRELRSRFGARIGKAIETAQTLRANTKEKKLNKAAQAFQKLLTEIDNALEDE